MEEGVRARRAQTQRGWEHELQVLQLLMQQRPQSQPQPPHTLHHPYSMYPFGFQPHAESLARELLCMHIYSFCHLEVGSYSCWSDVLLERRVGAACWSSQRDRERRVGTPSATGSGVLSSQRDRELRVVCWSSQRDRERCVAACWYSQRDRVCSQSAECRVLELVRTVSLLSTLRCSGCVYVLHAVCVC